MVSLFDCCRFTEFDKMALMPSKDNDAEYSESRRTPKREGMIEEEN